MTTNAVCLLLLHNGSLFLLVLGSLQELYKYLTCWLPLSRQFTYLANKFIWCSNVFLGRGRKKKIFFSLLEKRGKNYFVILFVFDIFLFPPHLFIFCFIFFSFYFLFDCNFNNSFWSCSAWKYQKPSA